MSRRARTRRDKRAPQPDFDDDTTAAFIEQDLRAADAAMASGDVVAMIQALKALQEIEA